MLTPGIYKSEYDKNRDDSESSPGIEGAGDAVDDHDAPMF